MFAFGMTKVDGSTRDVDNIANTFRDELGFAVYKMENPTKEDLVHFIKAAATYKYPPRCKYRSFYFSGHGGVNEKRQGFFRPAQKKESDIILIREMILAHFQHIKYSSSFIFFFDCCLLHSQAPSTATSSGSDADKNCIIWV